MYANGKDEEQGGIERKESIITILSSLGFFSDQKVHSFLINYYYHPDNDISCTAIKASASKDNLEAVSHLFQLIDRAKIPIKIEAVRALAEIRDPLVVEKLMDYFSLFQELEIKEEILKAANALVAKHHRVAELNRGILLQEGQAESLKEISVQGLIQSGDFDSLLYFVPHASASIQKSTFKEILNKDITSASELLKKFEDQAQGLRGEALGIYLCAYLLKSNNPKNTFILNLLQNAKKDTINAFLHGLHNNLEYVPSVKKVFRILLLLPYWDEETEKIIDRLLLDVLDLTKHKFPRAMNELISLTTVHLDTLFTKVSKGYLSIKNIKERDKLLAIFLARLFERIMPEELIKELQSFFKDKSHVERDLLLDKIWDILKHAEEADRKKFEAFIPLFSEKERIKRLYIYSIVKNIDPENPIVLERLIRVIKATGWLRVKGVSRKIWQILAFSREERLFNLEATCIVTLCELSSKNIILEFQQFFKGLVKNSELQRGYIRGARFFPSGEVVNRLLALLLQKGIDTQIKYLILDTLTNMDLSGFEKVPTSLLQLFDISSDSVLNEKAGEIIARYCDTTIFNTILDMTRKQDNSTKIIGMRILKELAKRDESIPMDVFTNRLYVLLEEPDRQIQIESLLTLSELGDDYAIKILKDWLGGEDEFMVPQILSYIKKVVTPEVLPDVLSLVTSSKPPIHETLRKILPDICVGKHAKVAKNILLGYLERLSGSVVTGKSVKESAVFSEKESLIHHPKTEFRFRREHSQNLTVFFIDIEGYTSRSIRSDMSSLMSLVRSFEEIVIPLVEDYSGNIIKKLGDGILAVFRHPVNAVLTAVEIQEEVKNHNRYILEEERFFVRIGIHTGSVIRKDGDVYGEVVNIASRMESAAKPGEILITEATYSDIKDFVQCRELGRITAKGIKEGIQAYTPERVFEETRKLLQVRKNNHDAFLQIDENSVFEKLKESLFSPHFHLPRGFEQPEGLLPHLQGLFVDMAQAVYEIATDYHEEYLFKRYLQDKWDELCEKFQSDDFTI